MVINYTDCKECTGILGGSFDPVHEGHIYIADTAIKMLGLKDMWFMVNPCNPFKKNRKMASFEDRVKLATEFVKGRPITVTDIEKQLETRETYDTLMALKERYGSLDKFVWVMGDDLLPDFPQWNGWKEIAEMIKIAVCRRNLSNEQLECLEAVKYFKQIGNWRFFDVKPNSMSSTMIRAAYEEKTHG